MTWLAGRSGWKLVVLVAVAMAAAGGIALGAYAALNEGEPQGDGDGVRVRWVNVSIERPPDEGGGMAVIRNEGRPESYSPRPGTRVPVIELFKSDPQSTDASVVFIDATTGDVVFEQVRLEDREAFDAVLATLRLEGPDPPDVWPYSGSPPEERRREMGSITYIEPEPVSGIKVGGFLSDFGPQGGGTFLTISNGRSRITYDTDTGEIVVPDEASPDFTDPVGPAREAFDRFTSSIELIPR
jgi:hypothetical protein